jgi:hypothetical protein
MTTNEKVARWLGWYQIPSSSFWRRPDGNVVILPDFEGDNTEAITLMPVLVEKGYEGVTLSNYKNFGWMLHTNLVPEWLLVDCKPTISQAITSAVILLIDKEAQ